MHRSTAAQLSLLALFGAVNSFQVDLWKGYRCSGDPLGHEVILYNSVGQTCFNYDEIHEALSITVQREEGDDPQLVVGFWGSPDCGIQEGNRAGTGYTASISGGCLDLADGYYGSMALAYADPSTTKRDINAASDLIFVNNSSTGPDTIKTGLEEFDWLQEDMLRDPEGVTRRREANKASQGSLNPALDPDFSEHGSYGEIDGQTVRFHQIARGVLVPVALEDWDDEIHVRDDTFLEWGDSYPIDFGFGVGSEFEPDLSLWEVETSSASPLY